MKNKITRFITAILIISIISPAVFFSVPPKKAQAGIPVADWLNTIFHSQNLTINIKAFANELWKQALMAVARKVLQQITQSTVTWINSGFHGNPLYIENSDSFFKDIAKSEVKLLVDMFGYDQLKYPFGRNFALNTINAYKSKLEDNAAYSLSSVMTDPVYLHAFQTDFNVGGWNGFLLNTQYPQNNYIGFQMIATEELARRVQGTTQTATQKVQQTLDRGMGFLSPQKCDTNPKYNNGYNEFVRPSFDDAKYNQEHPISENTDLEKWGNEYEAALLKFDEENTCPGGLTATTPGSVVANQITTALTSGTRATELSTAVGSSLATIFDTLLNKFIGDGLNSLMDNKSSSPAPDTWSYDGQTLDGNKNLDLNTLDIPQNVSVKIGDITNPSSVNISGGVTPYQIEVPPDFIIASASVSGSVLTINGLVPGNTSVTIIDSSYPAKRTKVQITVVGSGDLMVVPANISINPLSQGNAIIYGGTEPFTMLSEPNKKVAEALIAANNLVVLGVGKGQTAVVIKDSSSPAKIATIQISVKDSTEEIPFGVCLDKEERETFTTEADCQAKEGTWTPNMP